MHSGGIARRPALIVAVVLWGCLAVAIALATPWQPSGDVVAASSSPHEVVADDFTSGEVAIGSWLSRSVRLPGYLITAAGMVTAMVLGFTSLGARLSARAFPRVRGWCARVVLGALVVTLVIRLAVVPFEVWLEVARRRSGVSTQSWWAWGADLLVGFAVTSTVTAVLLVALVGLARWFPRWWWAPAAAVATAAVVLGSYVYPTVVEPLYNRFTPMADGPLRTSLLQLAERDGVRVSEVFVADASRRTTRLNAYVSGFGSTWRLVIYDTLLVEAPPAHVRRIVAHELGHAKRHDVLRGTLVGALAVGSAVITLALALDSRRIGRRAGVSSVTDPRVVALVLAFVAAGTLVAAPVQNLVSRRIETAADLHALDLTRDPAGYAETQRWLAVTNRSELQPSPLVTGLFATHPTPPERIALVRWWAARQGAPPVPALVAGEGLPGG
ncbi:M48 family metallopeptidase [Actinopolymorpha sp. B11F2]|uniref:M48 family metallopeptidase n=1 Tax=Actinopolymorpha sp. B11F2 TaxID=3160862 RepID=UPI0032E4CD9F